MYAKSDQELEKIFEFYDRGDDGAVNFRELTKMLTDPRRK